MNMILALLMLVLLSSCVRVKKPLVEGHLSSLSVKKFEPSGEGRAWSVLKVKLKDMKDGSAQEKQFSADDEEDLDFKVPYGSYSIELNYLDRQGDIAYQICKKDAFKVYVVNRPMSQFEIEICSSGPSGQVVGETSSDPMAGKLWLDPDSQAMIDARKLEAQSSPEARWVRYIAETPAAVWYGEWNGTEIGKAVKKQIDGARSQNATALMILYNIPYRDCGQHSAGGLKATEYQKWIQEIAGAIGQSPAIVVLEPDSLTLDSCLDEALKAERTQLLTRAIHVLKSKANTRVYLDAGHSSWLSADEISRKLVKTGIHEADGFALNVSNYQSTPSLLAFGNKVSELVGGKRFIIDTSRNGMGPTPDNQWCNPSGRALGAQPQFLRSSGKLEAYLWLKRPGESDGNCNGGPAAGQWWREKAIELVRNAGI